MKKIILSITCLFLTSIQFHLFAMRQQRPTFEGYQPSQEFQKDLQAIKLQELACDDEEQKLRNEFNGLTSKKELINLSQKIENLLKNASKGPKDLETATNLILVAVEIILHTTHENPQLFAHADTNTPKLREKYRYLKDFTTYALIFELKEQDIFKQLQEIVTIVDQIIPKKSRFQQFIDTIFH